ncbi:Helix-turn-helix domain-containing protein [Paenibacillus sp. UNCCL117]|uniref:helix-turn-helix domain-containing protein n=1 Tax=unclassified Paenibacillus TaxID=185978 RepID=UPI00087FED20|nr:MULTISPECIES: helix-turn-helix domain-containing protein [unclassified Paenibacillus]SDD49425.1 Helix-turn-helix domain-containing protein [Paenibacillus sp. cl123]SFW49976.1 Helix-turn-helix domain-containing protein [Paenibacillus sp. UNCCL117]
MKWKTWNKRSLMFNIFISFLGIILLFTGFNALSVHLFNKGVQAEIIRYNHLMLSNTAERYRTHFERLRTLLFNLYSDEKVVAFNRQLLTKSEEEIEFWKASEILKELRTEAYNPMFYLNNLMIYFDSHSLVIEKEGTVEAGLLFTDFYASPAYPPAYWKAQFERTGNYMLHGQQTFTVTSLNASVQQELIPFTFRVPSSNYQIIALLDARGLQEAFYGEEDNRQFMIVQKDGSLLYRSSAALSSADIPDLGAEDYAMRGGYYFFAEKDAESGLTYVTAVPYASIESRVRRASLTLLLVSAISVIIGLLASLYFSRKINRPVKQMISSILRREPEPQPSAFHEFNLIQQNVRELMDEKQAVHQELLDKRSLLTSFGYINKLKSITSDINEWKDIALLEEPFFIVLFQLHFRLQQPEAGEMKTERMSYYIHEYIRLVLSEQLPASHTFQIENNQILSLVRSPAIPDELQETLLKLKTILDRDKAYFLVTVAVSEVYGQSAEFNDAYQEVLELARQARPLEETQIIRERRALPAQLVFTVPQEQELYANLQAGNGPFCISFMERMMEQMDRREASLYQLRQLMEGVIARVAKILEPYGAAVEDSFPERQFALVRDCCTMEQFRQLYEELFRMAAGVILSKKEEQDPTMAFVMDYVENRFADDASLDMLADKLGLSPAYLSVLIKEKTGANYSEHINAVRIRKAKELLSGTGLSVQEISARLGYQNVTSFIRMFKKINGVPPGEYRKSCAMEAERG